MFKRKSGRRSASVQPLKHLFHGIAIEPSPDGCEAAQHLAGFRFLSEEAPRLPLDGCSCRTDCGCTYRHFQDRRTDTRRESDLGLPQRLVVDDKREGVGRRVTDG